MNSVRLTLLFFLAGVLFSHACHPDCLECVGHLSTECVRCETGAHLGGALPNSCACDTGLLPDGDAQHCGATCHPDCDTCSGLQASDCQSCGPNAHLNGAAPSNCVCDVGFCALSPDAMHCTIQACHPDCATCSGCGQTECLTCGANASLSGFQCRCVVGYCESPDAMHCTNSCDPTCLTCSGCRRNDCLTCHPNAILRGNHCKCLPGFCIESPDSSNCLAASCDPNCLSCSGCDSTDCTACDAAATLSGSSDCLCNAPTYPSPDAMHCSSLCDASCQTCSGPNSGECLTCFASAGVTAGVCSCVIGYYPNTTAANCVQCPGPCIACSTALRCWVCATNASLSSIPGTCSCDLGFYEAAGSCLPCISSCRTCTGASSLLCTSCFSNASLETTAPSRCLCGSGFYPNPSAANCSACDSSCASCLNSSLDNCMSCKTSAQLLGSAPSACGCRLGFFPSPTASNCLQCSAECLSCAGVGRDKCTKCWSDAFLLSGFPGACECNPGFFPDPDASKCSHCDSSCKTCVSRVLCTACRDAAVLQSDSTCQCSAGYFPSPDAGNCLQCVKGCEKCRNSLTCVVCATGWFSFHDGCSQSCPSGYVLSRTTCVESLKKPPVPTLFVLQNNSLLVTFSTPVSMKISVMDLEVDLSDVEETLYIVTWSQPMPLNATSLLLDILISPSHIPADNQVTLLFLHPSVIVDAFGTPIQISTLEGTLHATVVSASHSPLNSTIRGTAAAFSQGTIGASLVVSILTGSSAPVWSLLNQLQLITYIPMTGIAIPNQLSSTLIALNLNSLIPNPFQYVFPDNDTSQLPPGFAVRYEVETTLFLMNMGIWTSAGILILISAGVLSVFSAVGVSRCRKMLLWFRWTIPLRWWLQSYLDFGVFAMLQLYRSHSAESLHSNAVTVNFALSIVTAFFFGAMPGALLAFIWARQDLLLSRSDALFNKRWSILTAEFTKDKRFSSVLYYEFFIVRRFLFAFVIVWMEDEPLAQGLISFVLCALIFGYVAFWRPFETRFDQISAFISECCTALVFLISALFVFDLSITASEYTETAGVWVVFTAIASNALMSIVQGGLLLRQAFLNFKKNKQVRANADRTLISTTIAEEPALTISTADHKFRKDFVVD